MNTSSSPLLRLAQSRKALMLFFVLVSVVLLAALDKIKGTDALQVITVVVPAWLLSLIHI